MTDSSPPTDLRLRTTRRRVLALGVGAFVVAAVPFAARRRTRLVRRRVPVMGTIAEVAVVHTDPQAAHAAIDDAFAELRFVDRTMSRYRLDSDIGRANRRAAAAPVRVSAETAAVLRASLRWAESTDGAFAPCLGRAVELWDVATRTAPPEASPVGRFAGRGLYRSLDIDTHLGAPVVRLPDADAALDLGGIAKGYAVDRAVQALRDAGIEHGLVNAGGDLYALGRSEDGDAWLVGVRDPADPAHISRRFPLEDAAVATSGDYERFFEHAGRRYHHLLDPRTAAPRESSSHSVTVLANRCMDADAGATAAFGRDAAWAERALRSAATGARIVRSST